MMNVKVAVYSYTASQEELRSYSDTINLNYTRFTHYWILNEVWTIIIDTIKI